MAVRTAAPLLFLSLYFSAQAQGQTKVRQIELLQHKLDKLKWRMHSSAVKDAETLLAFVEPHAIPLDAARWIDRWLGGLAQGKGGVKASDGGILAYGGNRNGSVRFHEDRFIHQIIPHRDLFGTFQQQTGFHPLADEIYVQADHTNGHDYLYYLTDEHFKTPVGSYTVKNVAPEAHGGLRVTVVGDDVMRQRKIDAFRKKSKEAPPLKRTQAPGEIVIEKVRRFFQSPADSL